MPAGTNGASEAGAAAAIAGAVLEVLSKRYEPADEERVRSMNFRLVTGFRISSSFLSPITSPRRISHRVRIYYQEHTACLPGRYEKPVELLARKTARSPTFPPHRSTTTEIYQ